MEYTGASQQAPSSVHELLSLLKHVRAHPQAPYLIHG